MFTASPRASYTGAERRHHVVFRTRNTEYHLRDQICVAVRDPKTGEYVSDHPALGRRMSGALRFGPGGEVMKFVMPGEAPDVGDVLFFTEGNIKTELHTSSVCDIWRPPRDAVAHYLH